jgi:hypothetical protein
VSLQKSQRSDPVLTRLDRALFNQAWSLALSNYSLSSLPRPTSDHVPLLVMATTFIPRLSYFRSENMWLSDPLFLSTTLLARHTPAPIIVVISRHV